MRTLEEVPKSSKYLYFVSHIAAGHLMVMIIIQFDRHFETETAPLIPILEIKDPSDHGPLILQPMFVGAFDKLIQDRYHA